jgi:amino acid transporter
MSVLDTLLGRPLASNDEGDHKIGVVTGVPTLGLDGLGSAAYGPEAALTILLPLGALGLAYIGPITIVILFLLGILYLSYRQTIAAYPNGGGSYTVAKENLGVRVGLLAAAALMLDYTLNVAVGISTGVGALISAVPSLHAYILPLCLGMLGLITIVNLRGARESGVLFALPTYVFVLSLMTVVVLGTLHALHSHGHPHPIVAPPQLPPAVAGASLWLLLRAFASGCTAMTGVEAVSNGVTAFKEPRVPTAQRTLTAIVLILGLLLAGIAYLSRVYHIGAMDQTKPDYQSVLSQLSFAIVGRGAFYYVTLASVLAVLALSANTSYAGFPRLCRLIAQDSYLPHSFAEFGRRLVYSVGIVFLTALSAILLIVFGGITDRLIPLFAVGAFGAFTLSQAGMVMHWRRLLGEAGKGQAKDKKGWAGKDRAGAQVSLVINAVGAITTSVALVVIIVAKFVDGAWITILIIPMLIGLFHLIKRHYDRVEDQLPSDQPVHLQRLDPPAVVVPINGWNRMTARAIRFALSLSVEVTALHMSTRCDSPSGEAIATKDEQKAEEEKLTQALQEEWAAKVEAPAREAGLTPPRLVVLPSPYRQLSEPLLHYIDVLKELHPNRQIAVVIPELVERSWWEMALHGHAATAIKTALLFKGDPRVVVISVPWYLDKQDEEESEAPAHRHHLDIDPPRVPVNH